MISVAVLQLETPQTEKYFRITGISLEIISAGSVNNLLPVGLLPGTFELHTNSEKIETTVFK